MTEPNFFILGAPKCGTTSLASWLSQHPNVYISPVKEPGYFSSDFLTRSVRTQEAYHKLFESANSSHIAIGEATTSSLRSRVAVPRIESELHTVPRYIVMLRNPVEMAPSLHWQAVFAGHEDVEDFSVAWGRQEDREKGEDLPRKCPDRKHVLYRHACQVGEQLCRLYSLVDKTRVLTVFLDDIKKKPEHEWRRIEEFLGIPHWNKSDFGVENRSKHWHWRWVRDLNACLVRQRQRLGFPSPRLGIYRWLSQRAVRQGAREPLSLALRRDLQDVFSDDVRLLGELTGRDLSHWLS